MLGKCSKKRSSENKANVWRVKVLRKEYFTSHDFLNVCMYTSVFVSLRCRNLRLLQFEKSITIVRPHSRRDQNFQLVLACWFMFYLEFIKVLRIVKRLRQAFWILSRIKFLSRSFEGEIILKPPRKPPPFSVSSFVAKIIIQIREKIFNFHAGKMKNFLL